MNRHLGADFDDSDTLASYEAAQALASRRTIRIAHLSDLHFVTHPLLKSVTVKGLFGHDEDALNALRTTLTGLSPDLLFVTGDQTTWGDTTSLKSSFDFIQSLRKQLGLTEDCVHWIPGNHDVLLHYYFGVRFAKRKYERVFGEPRPFRELTVAGNRVAIFSFDSTLDRKGEWSPLWPLVGSRGRVSANSFNDFNSALQQLHGENEVFSIAQVHHHPLPIPYKKQQGVSIELTTMTNGATFIAHMQQSGVALVLHGHEHIPYSCHYCFDPRLANSIVVAAGTTCQLKNERMSFNYIEVLPKARIAVCQYDHRETGFYIRRDCTKIFVLNS